MFLAIKIYGGVSFRWLALANIVIIVQFLES